MAMSAQDLELHEAARLWAIRVQEPAFDDWEGFTSWLEGDPAHLEAYEAALADEAWAVALLAAAPATPVIAPEAQPQRRWWIAGSAAAAAAVAVIGGWAVLDRDAPAQQIETAPGEHRTIDLADGSKLALNGSTRVTIDPDTPRQVMLEQGEARFEVRHDASNPFVVLSGGTRLVDAGTVFNVVRDGDALPSVRSLAADFGANPLTVAKAYQGFQDEGLIVVKRGVGMFVAPGARARLRDSAASRRALTSRWEASV